MHAFCFRVANGDVGAGLCQSEDVKPQAVGRYHELHLVTNVMKRSLFCPEESALPLLPCQINIGSMRDYHGHGRQMCTFLPQKYAQPR